MRARFVTAVAMAVLAAAVVSVVVAADVPPDKAKTEAKTGTGGHGPSSPDGPAIGSKVWVDIERHEVVSGKLSGIGGTLIALNEQWVAVSSTDNGGRRNDFWIPRGKVVYIRIDEPPRANTH